MYEQLALSEWTHSGPNWLSIPQARFFFSPLYVNPGTEFVAFVAQRYRATTSESACSADIVQLSDFAVAMRQDQVQLVIDGTVGELYLKHVERGQSLSSDGFSDVDYRLVAEPDALPLHEIEPAYRQHVVELASFGVGFSYAQRRSFEEALQMGHAMLVGRWHALTEPFRPIQPDQWRHFLFDPASSPIARAEHGSDQIFSPMVMPIERKPVADGQAHDATDPTLSWLVGEMKIAPTQPRPRKRMLIEARKQWPDTSDRKIKGLWTTAVSLSGAVAWSAPGRRSK